MWRTEDGLPSNHVTALTQTEDGYLWVGTDRGLARFDGKRFWPVCEPEALKGDIRDLTCGHRGEFGVKTRKPGIFKMGVDGSFMPVRVGRPVLFDVMVFAGNGAMFFSDRQYLVSSSNGIAATYGYPAEMRLGSLSTCRDGTLSMLDEAGDLWLFNHERWRAASGVPAELHFSGSVTEDAAGALWTTDEKNKIWRRDKNDVWRKFEVEGLPGAGVEHLVVQPDGTAWAALAGGNRLLRLESPNGGFRKVPLTVEGIAPVITTLFTDLEGHLWAGTREDGLLSIAPARVETGKIMMEDKIAPVTAALELSPGEFAVGTQFLGTFHWQNEQSSPLFDQLPHPGNTFTNALALSPDGSLWEGMGGGLRHYRDARRVTDPAHSRPFENGNSATALCADAAGDLWAGDADGNIYRIRQGVMERLWQGKSYVHALEALADGTMWAGTDTGVLRFSREGTPVAFAADSIKLFNNRVAALHCDRQGCMWVGTSGGGLSKWSPEAGRFLTLSMKDGLPDNTIQQIIDDGRGRLWLGTHHGIAGIRFEEMEEIFAGKRQQVEPVLLGRSDGMPAEQCTLMKPLKTADGRLLFGTMRGFVLFDPAAVAETEPEAPPAVSWTEISTDSGTPQPLFGWKLPLVLELSPGAARTEVGFTGSSPARAGRTRFRWRMTEPEIYNKGSGVEERLPWTEAGANRLISFMNLAPGDHRLEVQASTGRGMSQWTQKPGVLVLRQRPLFRQTGYFAGLVVAGVALCGALPVWLTARARESRLKAVNSERERIARDLHDNLSSGIAHAGMLASTGLDSSGRARLSERLRGLMLDLDVSVWSTNPRQDSLLSLGSYLCEFTREFLRDSQIQCHTHLAGDLPDLPMPPGLRHHLFMACREALTNALKHSGATTINLQISTGKGMLRMEINDDGQGFDQENTAVLSRRNGIRNLRNRLQAAGGSTLITSAKGKGCTITLFLPLRTCLRSCGLW